MSKTFKKKKKEGFGYFDLSAKEQKRILRKCAQEANKEQLKIIKKYDKLKEKDK